MKTVLHSIDHNKHQLVRHPLFQRLRSGTQPQQQQRLLIALAAMVTDMTPVLSRGTGSDLATLRPSSQRLLRLIWLAPGAIRPAVLNAVAQAGRMLSAYLAKLCECEAMVPGPALQSLAAWDHADEQLHLSLKADAWTDTKLNEPLRQQAMNLIDAVFELVEGGCDDGLQKFKPASARPIGLRTHDAAKLFETRWLGGARALRLRPVLPKDEELLSHFLLAQSANARRNRFHAVVNPSPLLCRQMSQIDDTRHLALVVSTVVLGEERLVAEARYSVVDEGRSAEFALMVDEGWQQQGVGAWVLQALQQAAARAGLSWLEGEVLQDNQPMLHLAQRCGFACIAHSRDEGLIRVRRQLDDLDSGAVNARSLQQPPGFLKRWFRTLTDHARSMTHATLAP